MVQAAPAAIALCLRFSVDLAKAAAAALLIGAVLSATEQHADLSASILQGFQCIPASDLPAAAVLAFAQGLQNKTADLSSAQLSCLARLLAAKNLTADFGRYPPDLLLFFDSTEVQGGTCRDFYARASRGNLDLLPRGSAHRMGLLRGALACLGVRSSRLSPEQLSSLGALVCDMEPETIMASDPGVLENLKLCPALTGAQRDTLNAVLLGGGTAYGDPSSWNLQTLQNLGPLVLALNQTTLSLVAEAVWEAFGRSIVATYGSQGRSEWEKALTFLRAFAAASASSQPRWKRNTDGCQSTPLTASTDFDPLLFLEYTTSEQFDLCLSNEFLKANLGPLLQEPLPMEYLLVVKKKLKQIYPSVIPEEQLKVLGPLSRQYTAAEISQWMVTSSDTLSALLDPSNGMWEPPQVQQLLSRYLALGGTLTGSLLQKINGRDLCDLQEEQIDEISPQEIGVAGQLNISSCSQTKKDQLYRKAREAFAGQAGTTRVYYCQIQPYLGGAPAKDLKDLAKADVNMDIDTFLALNPEELQKLSVMDVKNLLGKNLPYLKAAENETAVMSWVKRQSQRELDCALGIGLQGGTEEPGTTPQPPLTTSASVTPTPTTLPTPVASSSHPTAKSSTASPQTPTPSATSPTPPDTTPPRTYAPSSVVSPAATSSAQPAPTTGPCSIQCVTPNNTPPPSATLLTTLLSAVNASVASPSSIPTPVLTHGATTTSIVTNLVVNTSTPLVSMNPPVPGGTTNPAPATQNTPSPSTPNAPSALGPNSTSAPATTEMNLPPHKPTLTLNSTTSTQAGVVSPVVKTTTLACKTDTLTAAPSPSSTTTTSETTKEAPTGTPASPRPTVSGYINLQPEPGSGFRLCSSLLPVLTVAVGSSLLQVLL
ncbi:mesothelin-like protein [Athene cunicularia]|uniref:mesothelin-like protein n=1 Tax=Athene cunicularia TaxID=194338 RepID=UPI000EF69605|nr:mesothelin-like protein [Athene cunicularia]